jgi:hypothetical protein
VGMRLIYLPHSIAFNDGNGNIYINKYLKEYDRNLFNRILVHEKSHTMGAYNLKDFILDYKNDISQWELFKFCLKHPSGFAQYSPIVKVNDIWFYSWLSALKLVSVVALVWLMTRMF